ncbi:ABC transporter substrate-binding protein [Streptomyces sp. NPDC014733]|uniref:ABC transporter substrate-binding protein n=1 Tax=Streptomyces sp. NPDC014733 TaxID=3364885 RepID=UPI0036FED599
MTALVPTLVLTATACTTASEEQLPVKNAASAVGLTSGPVDRSAAALLPGSVKSKGVVTFAMDASYAPFEFFDRDNRTVVGFDVDLSTALAARMGVRAKQVNTAFDGILPGLQARKYDAGISGFAVTPEREKQVNFVEYLAGGTGLGIRAGNPHGLRMTPRALCGHTIGAQKGTVQGLEQLPDISKSCVRNGRKPVVVQLFPSQNEANLALASGRAEAVMADSISTAYQARLSGGRLRLAPGPDYERTPTGIAVPRDSRLIRALAAALKSLKADGTFDKIAKKWSIPRSALPTSGS